MGGTGEASFTGYAPIVEIKQGNPEALKYGKLWENTEGGDDANLYRKVAPGEQLAQEFLKMARPKAGATCIDFGCGTGRGAFMLALLGGMKVLMVDFVRNSLDQDVRDMLVTQSHALSFMKADLGQPIPAAAEYGFCTDVMEHIPREKVGRVLGNILTASQHVFFSISTTDDSCGKLIGETLHMTVAPYEWWLRLFNEIGYVVHYSSDPTASALS